MYNCEMVFLKCMYIYMCVLSCLFCMETGGYNTPQGVAKTLSCMCVAGLFALASGLPVSYLDNVSLRYSRVYYYYGHISSMYTIP